MFINNNLTHKEGSMFNRAFIWAKIDENYNKE